MFTQEQIQNILITVINEKEGGFVLSKDADGGDGGWTFGGVTAKTYHDNIKTNLSYADIQHGLQNTMSNFKQILKQNILRIYQTNYLDKLPLVAIPDNWDLGISDLISAAINLGPQEAIKILQRSLGLKDDGSFGPVSQAKLQQPQNTFYVGKLHLEFTRQWLLAYAEIVKAKPEKAQFLPGWINRVLG